MGDNGNIMSIAKDRQAIAFFFSKKENKLKLFNQIVELIKTNNDFYYIENDIETFNTFQDCIIDGHFQWIVDIASNDYASIEFDSKYTMECLESNGIYHSFYVNFEKTIPKLNLSPVSKKILFTYSNFLKEEYL